MHKRPSVANQPPVVKDRLEHVHVGEMACQARRTIGIIRNHHVARRVLGNRVDGDLQVQPQEARNTHPPRKCEQFAGRPGDSRGVVCRFLDERRVRGAHQRVRHRFGRRREMVLQNLQRDAIGLQLHLRTARFHLDDKVAESIHARLPPRRYHKRRVRLLHDRRAGHHRPGREPGPLVTCGVKPTAIERRLPRADRRRRLARHWRRLR